MHFPYGADKMNKIVIPIVVTIAALLAGGCAERGEVVGEGSFTTLKSFGHQGEVTRISTGQFQSSPAAANLSNPENCAGLFKGSHTVTEMAHIRKSEIVM